MRILVIEDEPKTAEYLHQGLTEALGVTEAAAREALTRDYQASGAKSSPAFLQLKQSTLDPRQRPKAASPTRQARHQQTRE